jgi:hypothetical protein
MCVVVSRHSPGAERALCERWSQKSESCYRRREAW